MTYIKYIIILEKKNYNINNNNFNFENNFNMKCIVNYLVLIFGIIIILIFILFIIYYLTPNNYEILTFEDLKFNFQKQIQLIIKPKSTTQIDLSTDSLSYLKFPSKTNLVIKNIYKSQNIYINNDNELIKSKYNSKIFLVNNSDSEQKIIIYFYLLKH